jgi:glycosyltransferase involved in cell wall biosynthesis
MKLLVDCRCFTRSIAGTATFLRLALDGLQKQTGCELWLLTPKEFKQGLPLHLDKNKTHLVFKELKFWGRRIPIPNILWYLIYAPKVAKKLQPDIFFTPSPSLPCFLPKKTKKLIIVHDMVHILYRDTMNFKNKLLNILFTTRSINTADYIWTNSQYTKNGIIKYYPKRKQKEIYVGDSDDTSLYRKINLSDKEIKDLKIKYGIKDKFLLFVGTLEPRKNLSFLLKVFSKLLESRHDVQLVIVGARGWKNSDISKIVMSDKGLRENAIFTGYVSNEDLVALYNIADVLVSTSLNEGLGLPQLEAIFCGCPVVTAHNSAMIETTEGRGVTVKGWDIDIWVKSINNVLNSDRATFYEGKKDMHEYQWDNIIAGMVKYIQEHK